MKTLNVGMIGTGFMGRAHSNACNQVGHFFDLPYRLVLKSCHSRNLEKARKFQSVWGYESVEEDWRKLVERDDIDLVVVVTPNYLHKEMVIAAAEAGKAIICEKPLAMNMQEATEMVAAVEAAGVPSAVSFCYRRNPSVALFKQLIDENRIGRPFHYRATIIRIIQSEKVPVGGNLWRLDGNTGSGVTGDLLAHPIDTAEWLNGPIEKVCAHTKSLSKNVKTLKLNHHHTIDDACMFLAVFKNGSIGTFEYSLRAWA